MMSDERTRFTVVFEGDIRKFRKNPLHFVTEFGPPCAIAAGHGLDRLDAAVEGLKLAKQMNDTALGQFDWGRSCLSGEAIGLLNEAPTAVNRALAKATGAL